MILYLDTSGLVKLFFHEAGSKHVLDLVAKADSALTSQVAYAEACSALARRKRDKKLTAEEFDTAKERLDEMWPQMDTIIVDEKPIEVTFCSFDDRQNEAAPVEGLVVKEPGEHESTQ